jgi:hypothetical protein
VTPTLADLIADPGRAAELSPADRDAVLRQLAGLVLVLATATTTTTEAHGDGPMLTPTEAAGIAAVAVPQIWRWARRHDARPWVRRLGRRTMRIAEREFRTWLSGAHR